MSDAKIKPVAIDLFSGGGGLSLGLKNAGFDVIAAVELDERVTETYKKNHKDTKLIIDDIRNVTGKIILEGLNVKDVDLIAGCPPCQGFSTLTNKYKRKDPRNDLVLEMGRIIEEIKPKMVMMENVPGLADKGKNILRKFVSKLEEMDYVVNSDVLQLADFGIPQMRRRLVLLAGHKFKIDFPKRTHSYKADELKGLNPRITMDAVIKNMKRPTNFARSIKNGGPMKYNWHVTSVMTEENKKRLKSLKPGNDRLNLNKKIRPKCHKKTNEGFSNVYGRLKWNMVSPTMTSGFTTLSKGRFGHPTQNRTLSVREAALIQTFPEDYMFHTDKITTACDIIGNALPPKFAELVSKSCFDAYYIHTKN